MSISASTSSNVSIASTTNSSMDNVIHNNILISSNVSTAVRASAPFNNPVKYIKFTTYLKTI